MKKKLRHYPNLIIIGPPKTGTTSLFSYLLAHPDVCGSTKKETCFFYDHANEISYYKNYNIHGIEPYFEYFQHYSGEKIVMESSPSYLYMKTPVEQFSKFPNKPKIIFIYRDPAERVYSEFTFTKYKLKNFQGEFKDYVGFDGKSFNSERFKEGFYDAYLDRWKQAFADRFYSFQFQELANDPQNFMKKVCLSIGIDPSFYKDFDFNITNKTIGLHSTNLHKLALIVKNMLPKSLVNLIHPLYLRINSYRIPKMSEEERKLISLLKKVYSS